MVSPSCLTQKHLARGRQTEAPSMVPPRPSWLPRLFRYGKLEWVLRPALPLARTPETGSAHRSFRQSEYRQLSTRAQAAGLPVMGIGDLQAGARCF
jgi:hypothetical protein